MAVNPADVQQVALLARLSIKEAAIDDVTERFSRILDMVAALDAVATDGVAPMSNPHDATQRLRADTAVATDQRGALLANAPDAADGYFLVPRVIE